MITAYLVRNDTYICCNCNTFCSSFIIMHFATVNWDTVRPALIASFMLHAWYWNICYLWNYHTVCLVVVKPLSVNLAWCSLDYTRFSCFQLHAGRPVILFSTRGIQPSSWRRPGSLVWLPSKRSTFLLENDAKHRWLVTFYLTLIFCGQSFDSHLLDI